MDSSHGGTYARIPDLSQHRTYYGLVLARPGRPSIVAIWQTGAAVVGVYAGDELRPGSIVACLVGPEADVGGEVSLLFAEGWVACPLKRFVLPANGLVGITPGPGDSILDLSRCRPDDAPHNSADEGAELL